MHPCAGGKEGTGKSCASPCLRGVQIFLLGLIIIGLGLIVTRQRWVPQLVEYLMLMDDSGHTPIVNVSVKTTPVSQAGQPDIVSPLDRAKERVTKKPFGIYIDKATSPVQPERFSGYHTGTDFETFPEEALTDVAVRAVCSGDVMSKRSASGYGGVLVTDCVIDGQKVTVIYGHLRLSSIEAKVGERVTARDRIGLLGTGGTSETDGERKHLHLGIHLGSAIDILGYVPVKGALSRWLDPCRFVCR